MTAKVKVEDAVVHAIRDRLRRDYCGHHRRAKLTVYRYNSVSVRVRIVDPDFKGQSLTQRDSAVWDILDHLPDETRADVSLLVLLTPEEAKSSLMNVEFDDPTPSQL